MSKARDILQAVGHKAQRGLTLVNRGIEDCLKYKHTTSDCASCLFNVSEFLVARFRELGYETQVLRFTENNQIGALVQIRNAKDEWKRDAVRSILGQQLSVNVRLLPTHNDLQVEISNGKWVDKTLAGIIAWTFFAPLVAAPVVGICRQRALVSRVINEMNLWLANNRPPRKIEFDADV